MSAPIKTVFVFTITGNQGSAVARHLLSEGVQVIGLTRDTESAKSKDLTAAGAKLIQGDMSLPETYEAELNKSDGVFLNTDFWKFYTGDGKAAKDAEVAQGNTVVDAVKRAGVRHLVYSALERLSSGRELYEFDAKDDIKLYIKSVRVPATFIYTSYYYSNILGEMVVADGVATLATSMPDDTLIPNFAVEQLGLWVKAAFDHPHEWIGKDMQAVAEYMTVKDYATVLSSTLGRDVRTRGVTRDEFMNDTTLDRQLWANYLTAVQGEVKRDLEASRKVVPDAWDFKTWIKNTPAVLQVIDGKV